MENHTKGRAMNNGEPIFHNPECDAGGAHELTARADTMASHGWTLTVVADALKGGK